MTITYNRLIPIALVWALPLLLIVYFWNDGDNSLAVVMLFCSLLVVYISRRRGRAISSLWKNRTTRALSYYLVWIIGVTGLSGFVAPIEVGPRVLEFGMLLVWLAPGVGAAVFITTDERLSKCIDAVFALGILCVITVLIALFTPTENDFIGRTFGVFGDSVAWVLSFYLLLALAYRRYVLFVAFLFSLALTGSLGAALVALVASCFYFLLLAARGRGGLYGLAVLLVGLLGALAAAVSGLELPAVQRLLDSELLEFTIGTRMGTFEVGQSVLSDYWLTGLGFNGFSEIVSRYAPESFFVNYSTNYTSTAQNQFLQVALDGGVIGLVLFLAALGSSLRTLLLVEGAESTKFKPFFGAGVAWIAAMAAANQSAVWLLPHSLLSALFAIIVGTAVARRLSRRWSESGTVA